MRFSVTNLQKNFKIYKYNHNRFNKTIFLFYLLIISKKINGF